MPRLWQKWRCFSLRFLIGLMLCLAVNTLPVGQISWLPEAQQTLHAASPPASEQLVQQGIERYQTGKLTEAIQLWEQALAQITQAKDRAVVHNNLAVAYRETGKLDKALNHWEQAIQIYRSQADDASRGQVAKLLTEQGQAYSDLGQYKRAIALLEQATKIVPTDQLTKAAAKGALGNAYWALGNYKQALAAQEESLKIAYELKNPSYITTALNNRGNVYASRAERYQYQVNLAQTEGDDKEEARLTRLLEQDTAAALKDFEQSVRESQAVGGIVEARALLNLNRILEKTPTPNQDVILTHWQRAQVLLEQAPDSREKVYALINMAQALTSPPFPPREEGSMGGLGSGEVTTRQSEALISKTAIGILAKAQTIAKNIGDTRGESFALGSLGHLYESAGQYDKAMELTRKAADAAQQVNAADSLYRWQWQAGRILKATSALNQAIASYNQAITTLQTIRGDIVAVNKELQFNFRDDVEPVYRQLMDLLLASATAQGRTVGAGFANQSSGKQITTEQNPPAAKMQGNSPLTSVVNTLELLKLAELQNFFGDECVQVALNNASGKAGISDPNAAVIYSVILDDRTELILQRPDTKMTSYRVAISKAQMQQEIDLLRSVLEKRETYEYSKQAQKVYDLLIRPMEAELAAAQPRTLVFINDGVLRQVPMAALYDGAQFLIEKYAIATTPSLPLTAAKPLNRQNLKALTLGLTVEKPPFAALTNVSAEVKGVQQILGGLELVDSAFTLGNLQAKLQKESYPVVHIATHGKFGVDSESTYLVGFDQNISIEEIDNLLRVRGRRQPVELLTLSACQTAAGDNRSALGIAGVAVRAGVQSAVATLWNIYDAPTVPLVEEFYRQLSLPKITKAEALQKAQLKLIADQDYRHPAVWSPFILIGNWL